MRDAAKLAITMALAAGGATIASPTLANTIDDIKARGSLNCPVPTGGYTARSEVDDKGVWRGLDADICRAIAAAVTGSAENVNFVPISWAQRFPTIQAGDIDLIVMATGWTLSRDTDTSLDFAMPYFFSGLQFLVRTDSGVAGVEDLNGATICATTGTTIERATADLMSGRGYDYKPVTFEKTEETASAFLAGRCDAIANSAQALGIIAAQQPTPADFRIVPEQPLTLEPEAIAVRGGDQEMLAVANYVLTALVEADELGITSDNVDQVMADQADNPRVSVLLGMTPGAGGRLGLSDTWARDAIKQVGSYGQIYDRYLGDGSPYKIPAGFNAVYSKGGLLFPLVID